MQRNKTPRSVPRLAVISTGFLEHQDREHLFLDEEGVVYRCTGEELRPLASSVVKLLDHATWKTASRRERIGTDSAHVACRES